MPKFDESVINFAVYEDSVEYVGMASASLLSRPLQSVSGAALPAMLAVILGHFKL